MKNKSINKNTICL